MEQDINHFPLDINHFLADIVHLQTECRKLSANMAQVTIGNVQSIQIDHQNGTFLCGADSSRSGSVAGVEVKGKKRSKY